MTKIERLLSLLPGLALFFSACADSKQPVTGTVAQESFSSPITTVSASRTDAPTVDAPVASDGTFALNLPKGTGYRLDFNGASGGATLVFPRTGGAVEWRFDVAGTGSAFDLGTVRQVGDPRNLNITFAHSKVKKHGDGGADEGDRDVECVNGQDPVTGAVCVEDTQDQGMACKGGKGGKHGKGHGRGEHGDAGCHRHGMCDGDAGVCDDEGKGHHDHDAGVDDDDDTGTVPTTTTGEAAPSTAAVADRNLPSALGQCIESDDDSDNQ